ncbi:cytidylate kinase [Ehrlichia chaffeensis str. Heartland]|uniref:Cytidylate kinase n=1 Tax=Ehrlichia chaffeensis (strain ATCC CRL-10679 / Arkansas) TaxID=205920 RepID=Q2GH60_EHRCR|nr:(d)CMP kinase [Ehrlichia chaffeensis]ABD45120.1 cytidylate kinase [Ehrlichia chaffeensis str. Arkansas]AHX03507.1 cytidylate kinase [Ehrlichia chaffeensis str. Heartland]AHX05772.1 cytidylate kinase [Ehrlichia chaffeensis str. Jax]AHX06764.1 cytidylate kinase [Ehrlichia chaffeensis str. Liberty]AHX07900.1 cytidylate kinase [Ehrlichia chaffeensis str. Osceola]
MTKHCNNFVITIDGPSASGKGSLAKKLANFLNFQYLDTGKLYRIIATIFGTSAQNHLKIDNKLEDKILSLLLEDNNTIYNNEDIGKTASILARYQHIRLALLPIQRKLIHLAEPGIILDGRDTSSTVFPEADLKIFITAQASIRAQRRFKEMLYHKKEMYKKIHKQILERDIRDTYRKFSPLVKVKDALYINTSYMNKEQVLLYIKEKIKTYL